MTFFFTTNTLSFAVFWFLSLFSLGFHSARLMPIKRPALKKILRIWKCQWILQILSWSFAGGIFYIEEEMCLSQNSWKSFQPTSFSFCPLFAPSPPLNFQPEAGSLIAQPFILFSMDYQDHGKRVTMECKCTDFILSLDSGFSFNSMLCLMTYTFKSSEIWYICKYRLTFVTEHTVSR